MIAGIGKTLGVALLVVGLSAACVFGIYAARDPEYAKAALLLERNPGNVMHEARFGAAAVKRAFLISASVAGILVALNGATLFLLGLVAARTESAAARGTIAADAAANPADTG